MNDEANTTVIFPARSVVTMDPSQPNVDAVAVRDGRVLAAGSLDECRSWGPHRIDDTFRDHVIVPGMIEAHAHSLEGAFALLPYVGWFDRHGLDGVRSGRRAHAARRRTRKGGQCLRCGTENRCAHMANRTSYWRAA